MRGLRRVLSRRFVLPTVAVSMLVGANGPPVWAAAWQFGHEREVNSAEYKRRFGFWQVINLPEGMRVNAIHAAVLDTGKVLIVAGSGNNATQFAAGTFKTLLFDPATGAT